MFGSAQLSHPSLEGQRILGFFWIKIYKNIYLYSYLFLPICMMDCFLALQFFCTALVFLLIMIYDPKTYY